MIKNFRKIKIPSNVLPFRVLMASMMGNALEQYDFMLYVFLSPVLAQVFFPTQDKVVSLILSMSVYAVGFLARPLGALYFGHMGDTQGRRKALCLSIVGMSVSTGCMGLVPSYETLGLLSPCLIVLLRLVQSFCVAGEYNGAGLYVLEHMSRGRQNLVSGIYTSSGAFGMLLCSLTLWGVLSLVPLYPQIWRIAFVFPVIFGGIGYYIRRSLTESFSLSKAEVSSKNVFSLLQEIFRENLGGLLLVFGISSFSGCLVYFLMALPNVFIPQVSSITLQQISQISTLILVIYIANLWIMGAVADRFGSLSLMIGASLLLCLAMPFLYRGLIAGDLFLLGVCLGILSTFVAAFLAPSHVVMKSLFPPHLRYTGISLGFNLGTGILGATSAAVSMGLYKMTGNSFAPLFYLLFCATLFLSIAFFFLIHKKRFYFFNKEVLS